jgi:hypothetical protein
VIEADPVGSAVRSLMATRTQWTGTASDLLGALAGEAGEHAAKSKTWPATARALSGRLRRAATFLRTVGIDIEFVKEGRARTRTIRISRPPENAPAEPSRSPAPSAEPMKDAPINGSGATLARTVQPGADASGIAADFGTVHENPNNSRQADDADAADAKSPLHSGGWRITI